MLGYFHGGRPYDFIGTMVILGPEPYQFIGKVAIHGPYPYELTRNIVFTVVLWISACLRASFGSIPGDEWPSLALYKAVADIRLYGLSLSADPQTMKKHLANQSIAKWNQNSHQLVCDSLENMFFAIKSVTKN